MENPLFDNSIFPGGSSFVIGGGTFTSSSTHIHTRGKGGFERLLDAVAPNALHNSGHDFDAPKCHPGTRTAVIQTIIDWAAGVHDGPRKKDIAWLTGAAGAGKSAIGRTVCERCAKEGTLLASFFFGANDATRNHSRSLVSTLVYQVCCLSPAVRQFVTTIIDNDPLILTHTLREQLSTLLITPLSSAFSNNKALAPRLVVIDGLDECDSHASQLEILDSLIFISNISHFPIRFLLCSRPESQITNFFSSPHSQDVLFKIYLGDEFSPDEDIRLYLSDRFKAIKQGHIHRSLIPDTWPEEDHMDQLVYNSSGQFIYASTVVYYVESPRHRPHQRLESVLGLRPPFKDLPFAQLDALYAHILRMADDAQLVVDILALPAFYGDFSAHHAELMLMLEPGDVQILLADCASIVKVEPGKINNIFLLHKSFSDFLRDPHRSKEFHRNYVDTVAKHISRIIEVFLEQQTGHRTSFWRFDLANILNFIYIPTKAWNTSAYQTTLTNITQFPMESFCKSLFSHNNDYQETFFLCSFLQLLLKSELNPAILKAYQHHIQSLCQCVLDKINSQYINDWKANYALAIFYLQGSHKQPQFYTGNDNLYAVLFYLSWDWAHKVNDQLKYTFQQLITPTNESQILARAAAYCFENISNCSPELGQGPRRFIHIQRNYRRIHQRRRKNKKYQFGVHCLFSIKWKNIPASFPDKYMEYLEYFICLLPHAEPYIPLVNMCKTKALSQMSIFFPSLSRRARCAIADYLGRTDPELGNGKVEVK